LAASKTEQEVGERAAGRSDATRAYHASRTNQAVKVGRERAWFADICEKWS